MSSGSSRVEIAVDDVIEGAAGAPHHHGADAEQDQIPGVAPFQEAALIGGGTQQHLGPLQRLNASDEGKDHGVGCQAQGGPRCFLRSRREELQVDSRSDGGGAAWVGAVELDELRGLG